MVFIVISALLSVCYLLMITLLANGWDNLKRFEPTHSKTHKKLPITVVVACKNEEKNIARLLSNLSQQSYQHFELIIVCDHSIDNTKQIIQSALNSFPQLKLMENVLRGKKEALKLGIKEAKYEFIVTTDADCIPTFLWLESIVDYYSRYKPDLIIAPVVMDTGDDLFDNLQSLEFCSLVASGAGAAGAGWPILCNGANLAFKKQIWLDAFNDLLPEVQSGDDMFLLHSLKRKGANIHFLRSESAIVTTQPMPTLKQFIHQRLRWSGKSIYYQDRTTILIAILVFCMSLMPFVLLYSAQIYPKHYLLLAAFVVFKYMSDLFYLNKVKSFFQQEDNLWFYALVLSIVYPFYVVGVAIGSLLLKPVRWK